MLEIASACGSALQWVRNFVHKVEEDSDEVRFIIRDFRFSLALVEDAFCLYQELDGEDSDESIDKMMARLGTQMSELKEEADEKYSQRPVKDKLIGVPKVFWQSNSQFLTKWLNDNEKLIQYMRQKVQSKRLSKAMAMDAVPFVGIDDLAKTNMHLDSILKQLTSDGSVTDLHIIEEIQSDPRSLEKHASEPIVQSVQAAVRSREQRLLPGSAVTVDGDSGVAREGELVDACFGADWEAAKVKFTDDRWPRCDWVKIPQISVTRWGPTLPTIAEIFGGVDVSEVPVIHSQRRAVIAISEEPAQFFKYYQHLPCMLDILRSHFRKMGSPSNEPRGSDTDDVAPLASDDFCHLVMLGNPGTGKSTILNALIGQLVFRAGLSNDGGGLTKIVRWYQQGGLRFGDVPGLDDPERRMQAAEEIEQCLKEDGTYKIAFVCLQDSLRVRNADIQTMKVILEAAPSITSYVLIINKISRAAHNKLMSNPDRYDRFLRPFNTQLPQKPSHIMFMLEDSDLADVDDVLKKLPTDMEDALHNLQGISIKQAEVGALDVTDWDEKINALAAQVAQSHEQLKEMREVHLQEKEQRQALQEQLEREREERALDERERESIMQEVLSAVQVQSELDREVRRQEERAREDRQREKARRQLQGDIRELEAACHEAANCKDRLNYSATVFDRNRNILLRHGGYCDNRNPHWAGVYIMKDSTMDNLEHALRSEIAKKKDQLAAGA